MLHWRSRLPLLALVAMALAAVLGKGGHGIGFFW